MSDYINNHIPESAHKLISTELPLAERIAKRQIEYKNNINQIVCGEDKNKYCLIFGNRTIYKFDTY